MKAMQPKCYWSPSLMSPQIEWGTKQILALRRMGNTEARASEGTAARTDPVEHLPEKFTGLRFIFLLDAFSLDG